MEQGGERKFWIGVRALCVSELLALILGSGVLWYIGLVHKPTFLYAFSAGLLGTGMVIGSQVEYWLGVMSREPLLNERGECDSTAPTERSIRYIFPVLIATQGIWGIVAHTALVPVLTSAASLGLFAVMLRRIVTIWRNRDPLADS